MARREKKTKPTVTNDESYINPGYFSDDEEDPDSPKFQRPPPKKVCITKTRAVVHRPFGKNLVVQNESGSSPSSSGPSSPTEDEVERDDQHLGACGGGGSCGSPVPELDRSALPANGDHPQVITSSLSTESSSLFVAIRSSLSTTTTDYSGSSYETSALSVNNKSSYSGDDACVQSGLRLFPKDVFSSSEANNEQSGFQQRFGDSPQPSTSYPRQEDRFPFQGNSSDYDTYLPPQEQNQNDVQRRRPREFPPPGRPEESISSLEYIPGDRIDPSFYERNRNVAQSFPRPREEEEIEVAEVPPTSRDIFPGRMYFPEAHEGYRFDVAQRRIFPGEPINGSIGTESTKSGFHICNCGDEGEVANGGGGEGPKQVSHCKRRMVWCCQFFGVLVGLAAIAFIVVWFSGAVITDPPSFLTKAQVDMRVDEPFQTELLNMSSPQAHNYTNRVCNQISPGLSNQMQVQEVQTCTVSRFSQGSVMAHVELVVLMTQNVSEADFKNILMDTGEKDGQIIKFGDLPVITVTLVNYTVKSTSDQQSNTSAEPGCTEAYKPLQDGYPSKCDQYLRCQNGKGVPERCEDGLEFAYDSNSGYGPCRLPSKTTSYCERIRQENGATTSSTSAVTSSSLVTTTWQSTTAVLSTTMTPTVENCSSVDQEILANNLTMYQCTGRKGQDFRPLLETAPNNCDAFLWCNDGIPLNITRCARGAHFVLGQTGPKACSQANDPSTFCAKMELAKNCR